MRNLKRVLALALALVMILGMMVMTTSAASYADQEAVDASDYAVAIEVLSGLGVFEGDDNNKFDAEKTLQRKEGAALVYRAITGDVEDEKIDLYDYSVFNDVAEGDWYTGYVTYAANGKYIVGWNGTFMPNDDLTGVQVLAMMLRALGYGQNGEYVGDAWQDFVLTDANRTGLTKGMSTNDLDKPISREKTAQIIFNALSGPEMVTYNILTGYQPTGETLGELNFDLHAFEGVLTANEYADLYDTDTLADGKTVIGGVEYNHTSTLQEIGLSYEGWAGGSDILHLVCTTAEESVYDNGGAAASINSRNRFKSTTGLTQTNSVEYFWNFGRFFEEFYTTEIRIVYDLDGDDYTIGGALDEDWVEIAPDESLTEEDYNNIRDIFYDDDFANGWVLVGTTLKVSTEGGRRVTNGSDDDYSNDNSFRDFVERFLEDGEDDETWVTEAYNGEWLRVIDTDNNGDADYVFLTQFWMDEVTGSRERNGVTVLTYNDGDAEWSDDLEDWTVVYDTELAVGDVVVSCWIDGKAYVDPAESVVDVVRTVDYKNETITTTTDVTYGQSGIGNDTEYAEVITDMEDKVEYEMYMDKYGYVRVYRLVEGATVYGLLTETYTTRRNNFEYITGLTGYAELTAGSADMEEYLVTNFNRGDNPFFTGTTINTNLLTPATYHLDLDDVDFTEATETNVAKYVLTEDGVSLTTAAQYYKDKAGRQWFYTNAARSTKTYTETLYPVYAVDYIELNDSQDISVRDKSYLTETGNNVYVNAVHSTEYYLVVRGESITYFTDYINVPAIDDQYIEAMYTVAENTINDIDDEDYWVARVVVIELNDEWDEDYESISLAFYNTSKTSGDVRYIDTLNNESDDPEVTVVPKDRTSWTGQWNGEGFYALYNTSADEDGGLEAKSIAQIGRDSDDPDDKIDMTYNGSGIYAGTVLRDETVDRYGDYVVVSKDDVDLKTQVEELPVNEGPIYGIYERTTLSNGIWVTKTYAAEQSASSLSDGDRVIWVMNGGKVAYIVNLDYSNNGDRAPNWLFDWADDSISTYSEWERIMDEQNPAAGAVLELTSIDIKNNTISSFDSNNHAAITLSVKAADGTYDIWANAVTSIAGSTVLVRELNATNGTAANVNAGGKTALTTTGSAGDSDNVYEYEILVSNGSDFVRYTITVNIVANTAPQNLTSLKIMGVEVLDSAGAALTSPVTIPLANNGTTPHITFEPSNLNMSAAFNLGATGSTLTVGSSATHAGGTFTGITVTIAGEDGTTNQTISLPNLVISANGKITGTIARGTALAGKETVTDNFATGSGNYTVTMPHGSVMPDPTASVGDADHIDKYVTGMNPGSDSGSWSNVGNVWTYTSDNKVGDGVEETLTVTFQNRAAHILEVDPRYGTALGQAGITVGGQGTTALTLSVDTMQMNTFLSKKDGEMKALYDQLLGANSYLSVGFRVDAPIGADTVDITSLQNTYPGETVPSNPGGYYITYISITKDATTLLDEGTKAFGYTYTFEASGTAVCSDFKWTVDRVVG